MGPTLVVIIAVASCGIHTSNLPGLGRFKQSLPHRCHCLPNDQSPKKIKLELKHLRLKNLHRLDLEHFEILCHSRDPGAWYCFIVPVSCLPVEMTWPAQLPACDWN